MEKKESRFPKTPACQCGVSDKETVKFAPANTSAILQELYSESYYEGAYIAAEENLNLINAVKKHANA